MYLGAGVKVGAGRDVGILGIESSVAVERDTQDGQ
jgi:hypothetical protein